MYYLREWFLTKETDKTSEWANKVLRLIRFNMQPLVSSEEAERGMDYLLGRQDMSFIKDLFQNTTQMNLTNERRPNGALGGPVKPHENHDDFMFREMSSVRFKPLSLLEKMRNVMIAEMKKMGPVVNVRSEDPTTSDLRKKDEALLKNKPQIENDLSDIYTKIGQPPVKLDHHEARFGEKPSSGNIDSFEKMGLDLKDPADIEQFMKYFYKLNIENAVQDIIDFCMAGNEVSNKTENWVNDIWAKKATGATCYVSDVTGKPTIDYLAPETIWIYGGGRRKDYNDANAKVYQQRISIKELIDRFGNSFDFENDWDRLLMAITFTGSSVEFTGIQPSWRGFLGGETYEQKGGNQKFGINDFMALKVMVGYAEWTSQNQETFGETNKETDGGFHQNNQPVNGDRYQTKARFETPTYKSFYLVVSEIDQILFNFGEMTYQQIEGYSDFNVNFSIITYKEIGDSMAIIAAPFLDIIHEAWFKWKYELRRALPPGREYNYESVLQIAEDMFMDAELTREAKFQKVLSFLNNSANIITTIPIIEGKPVANLQLMKEVPNGLSPGIKEYWDIITNTLDELQNVLTGSAPLRQGDPGGSRDSMNNQFKALEYSQNATAYVPDMLTYLYQQAATKISLFAQDIITYKKYNTLAYKYLADGVGEDTLEQVGELGKKSLQRYGIYVESLNQSAQRAKLSARIDFALQSGKITLAQTLLVEDIKSPTKALLWLGYFEDKTAKVAQKNAMQSQQQVQQGQMQLEQMKQQTEKIKGDYNVEVAQIQADGQKQSHIIAAQKQITTTAMKHESDIQQIELDAKNELEKESANIDATGKQTQSPPPPPPRMPAGGPPPQQQRPQSGIQQSISTAQPGATSLATGQQ